ncbi:MAG: hypothetical protein ACK2UB_11245, partial [Anaerolineales bacterium]
MGETGGVLGIAGGGVGFTGRLLGRRGGGQCDARGDAHPGTEPDRDPLPDGHPDRDGRGEILAWGVTPSDGEWTTEGVEVWQDSNNDVGGATPQVGDPPNPNADGYDEKLVADGQGADPDLAWIRQIEGGSKVRLALKYAALGNAGEFLWNGLADAGVRRHG